jgi:hypothetical protein
MYQRHLIKTIRGKHRALVSILRLDERQERLWAAVEARSLGWGGFTAVATGCAMSRARLYRAVGELQLPAKQRALKMARVRRPGAGRPPLTKRDPGLLRALERFIEPRGRLAQRSVFRWTCSSTERLAQQLKDRGYSICARSVAALLHRSGYDVRGQRGPRKRGTDRQRIAQCRHVTSQANRFVRSGHPVIHVRLAHKELPRKAGGRAPPAGSIPVAEATAIHRALTRGPRKILDRRVSEIVDAEGWVATSIDETTASFLATSIRQ